MKKVLVIGRHADLLHRILAMLEQNGYSSNGTTENADAIEKYKSWKPNVVVIGGGVDDESRKLFHKQFEQNGTKVLDAHPQSLLFDLTQLFS
jgi:DNA-binding NtrC family response regulator